MNNVLQSKLRGASILITGGTGSFGKAFTRKLLLNKNINKIVIFSRDEMKQWKMMSEFNNNSRLRFLLGDVRDLERLRLAFRDIDVVIHAAATKIVMSAEYNPFECIKTNVFGAMNVITASIDTGVKKLVALSTDKASSPVNLYGASKLCSDKLFVAANNYSGDHGCQFSVVRYGNVLGSRGSVVPFFLSLKKNEQVPVTDMRMTRFMITMDHALGLVETAIYEELGGSIFVRKIPSATIETIAKACCPNLSINLVGIRPGEKLHEQMISLEDALYTRDYGSYYKILPNINDWYKDEKRIMNGVRVAEDFYYSSDTNPNFLDETELAKLIEKTREKFEVI